MAYLTPTSSPSELEQLQILHEIENNAFSNNEALFGALTFPIPLLPISWKLAIYHFLTSLPLPEISPIGIILILTIGPVFMIGFLFFFTKYLLQAIKLTFTLVLSQVVSNPNEKTFLELTFPSNTEKTAFATEQLYSLIHTLARQQNRVQGLLKFKKTYSLEIVSTKKQGIRYVMVVPSGDSAVIQQSLLSYTPGIQVKKIEDYLLSNENDNEKVERDNQIGIAELKLSQHFGLPLQDQKVLEEHDIIAYLSGSMTKLNNDDLIAFQIVTTPVLSSIHTEIIKKVKELRAAIYQGSPLTPLVQKSALQKIASLPGVVIFVIPIKVVLKVFSLIWLWLMSMMMTFADSSGKSIPLLMTPQINIPNGIINPYEQELKQVIKEKIDQPLFESSMRIFVEARNIEDLNIRMSGIITSLASLSSAYQSLTTKGNILPKSFTLNRRNNQFKERNLSQNTLLNSNPIFSVSEISDIYHFPYANSTKTEDMVKLYSKELPAPLSLKQTETLDIVFAKNSYGGSSTMIGLTSEERARHMYVIGATGTGKSTMLLSMINQDIDSGKGICVVDPHGDLAEAAIDCVPEERVKDLIYFNPYDIKYPIGINLLELTPDLDEDDALLEKEFIAESVISLFRKVFSDSFSSHPHRIEYILRNTIHTAFTVENATLFTVFDLLNNPPFQKKVIQKLQDENLKNFWKYEFGRAGDFQRVKMVAPVTARIGRFLFSPSAKRILEQEKSTINFDEILDNKKLLICNLSKGNIGEDTSEVMGIMILNKIQLAALKRARKEQKKRNAFYLYVDEFQNFATPSFVQMLSEARKYGLNLIMAEQSTSQQNDNKTTNIILANTGTVVSFRSANPADEELLLRQYSPYIDRGDIANLPAFHFYMKKSALYPEEPFSGKTMPVKLTEDKVKKEKLVKASREQYAVEYKNKPMKIRLVKKDLTGEEDVNLKKTVKNSALPEDN